MNWIVWKGNEGILEAHTQGILTSVSFVAGAEAYDHAVTLAKSGPTLDVGVHLTPIDETLSCRQKEFPPWSTPPDEYILTFLVSPRVAFLANQPWWSKGRVGKSGRNGTHKPRLIRVSILKNAAPYSLCETMSHPGSDDPQSPYFPSVISVGAGSECIAWSWGH